MRVLIVDDSAVMRKLIVRNLRQAGFSVKTVLEASNGEEALAQFEADGVDLVLCDLNMPRMDGYELARRLRERAAEVPILLVTSEGSKAKVARARRCGVSEHLQKPPTPEELKHKIDKLLGTQQDGS